MGVTIAIDADDQETRERLAHQWVRAAVPASEGPAGRRIEAPTVAAEETDDRDYAVTTQVTLAALMLTSGDRFNLHAGGLADDEGRVLAVVGAPGPARRRPPDCSPSGSATSPTRRCRSLPTGWCTRTRNRCQ